MQGELLERFADTQTALIAALEAVTDNAMIAHTRDLGGITDALRTQGVLRADASTRSQLETLMKYNAAAAQRLRFLRDHVERRVAAIQGEQTVATYTGRPARR